MCILASNEKWASLRSSWLQTLLFVCCSPHGGFMLVASVLGQTECSTAVYKEPFSILAIKVLVINIGCKSMWHRVQSELIQNILQEVMNATLDLGNSCMTAVLPDSTAERGVSRT